MFMDDWMFMEEERLRAAESNATKESARMGEVPQFEREASLRQPRLTQREVSA
jgi:hypothetical protein